MIRPIITAMIEYLLTYLTLRYGTVHKRLIASILFLLASYQVGEVLIFATNGQQFAFKVAYVATTLLPPLGVLLVSRIIKKPIGYVFFQLLSLLFVAFIIWTQQVVLKFEFGQFCVRIFEYNPVISCYWVDYYQGTLTYTMAVTAVSLFLQKDKGIKHQLKWILSAYLIFDGLALVVAYVNPWFGPSLASLMCAMALIAAIIFTKISSPKNIKFNLDWHSRYDALLSKIKF